MRPAVLLLLNLYIARELFTTAYLAQMGSIEGAYIAIARYASQNWADLSWFPLWYAGIPYQNTYPPLLHLIVAAFSTVTGLSAAHAYHAVIAAMYCLGALTLYWLALRLSGSRWCAFTAGLVYSVFSPTAVLVTAVRNDMGGLFNARRFQALVQFGEGPHVTSMTLLPLAIIALDQALRKRRALWIVLAAAAMAAVVLTNWLGGFVLAAAVVAYLMTRTSAHDWLIALGIGVYAYVLAAPWIPPSTLAAVRTNAQRVGGPYPVTLAHLKYAGIALAALAAIQFCCDRWKAQPALRFAFAFAFLMSAVTLLAEWFRIYLLPQPHRYHLEMEMGLILLAVFAAAPLVAAMTRGQKAAVALGLALFCWFQVKTYRGYAKYLDRPIDIGSTIEYKAARWMDANLQGRRVFAPGSVSFFMNTWTDTPQLGGGFDQGLTNPQMPVIGYQVYSGEGSGANETEVARLWLAAYGVDAVMIGGPKSGEWFHPFRNPGKFESFRELWRDGDDVIYEVPRGSRSLAHVLRPEDLAPRQPAGGLDVDPMRPYVAAIDRAGNPEARFQWLSRRRARIDGRVERGQILSVQVTYHPGWHASVGGASRRVWRDNLGLLAIDPQCDGACQVELVYNGGLEMQAARALSWIALFAGLLWPLAPRLSHLVRIKA